jgi:hypothetical protein
VVSANVLKTATWNKLYGIAAKPSSEHGLSAQVRRIQACRRVIGIREFTYATCRIPTIPQLLYSPLRRNKVGGTMRPRKTELQCLVHELEGQMSHDTDHSHIDLSISSAKWPGPRLGLPIPGWPADLFKCNATEAELMTKDLLVCCGPFSELAKPRYQAFHP